MEGELNQSRPCHKAFNFDLVIAELKQHYPDGHHTKAYKDIQIFMRKNGFSHRQGSGYRSERQMSDVEVLNIVEKLHTEFPWFANCVNKFDVTDVGEVYDLALLFERYHTVVPIVPQPEPVPTNRKAQRNSSANKKPSIFKQLAETQKDMVAQKGTVPTQPKRKKNDPVR